MRFLLGILGVGLLCIILGWLLPWWSVALAGLIIGFLLGESGWKTFLFSLLGAGLAWFILCFIINSQNEGLMAEKIGVLFQGLSPILLMLVSSIIGGLVAAFGGLTGYFAQRLISPKNN